MKNIKVIIRAGSDNKIGMGHIYRCLALGLGFEKKGCDVFFLTKKNGHIKKILANKKYFFVNKKNEMGKIKNIGPDIIVVDNRVHEKKNEYRYMKLLKGNCKILVTIDDNTKGANFADIIINVLYPSKLRGRKIIGSFEYAILRREFSALRDGFRVKKAVENILVLQGGADTYGLIPKTVNILDGMKNDFKIITIVGPCFKQKKELEKVLNACNKDVVVYKNVKNIEKVMMRSDIAVTAAGNSLLELCCIGVPTITICAEKFEDITARRIKKLGGTINLGYYKNVKRGSLANNVENLIKDMELRKKLSFNGRKAIDGKGAERAVKIILNKLRD